MKKLNYKVSSDEWYPVHSIYEKGREFFEPGDITLTTKEKRDYDKVCRDFQKWQEKLSKFGY